MAVSPNDWLTLDDGRGFIPCPAAGSTAHTEYEHPPPIMADLG